MSPLRLDRPHRVEMCTAPPEQLSPAVQMRLQGALGDVQDPGGLGEISLLKVVHHDRVPIARGQSEDGTTHDLRAISLLEAG
jgi:hypothetical protein